ncbi:MAG: hypothetical protein H6865_07160 [Rhodospirillales bacterium]|nr:hypothetical protein [Alphaproteobacteria bacterium]MCB9987396.1 hypothetical protein [Rhodospirillales bacterium]USO07622.1 MAG: hypothetical protein H6866_09495 [Rhodospirillales bacterium]
MSVITLTDPRPEAIAGIIAHMGVNALHVTNGTYAYAREQILPTMLAGFKFIDDRFLNDGAGLLIAVNSDASMRDMLAAKGAGAEEFANLEPQDERAAKVAPALAAQFPGRRVFVCFYDQADPRDLYFGLYQSARVCLRSLQKWGYGAARTSKPILGAEYFENVFSFPLPQSVAGLMPVAWDVTPEGATRRDYLAVDLTRAVGRHGRPYISAGNQVLFPVLGPAARPAALKL